MHKIGVYKILVITDKLPSKYILPTCAATHIQWECPFSYLSTNMMYLFVFLFYLWELAFKKENLIFTYFVFMVNKV